MPKKILITGGAGFVGSHTADALLSLGYNVRIFDNLSRQVHNNGRPTYLPKNIEFIEGDVRDLDALTAALRGVDAVFHFAAAVGVGQSMYQIADYIAVNIQGTANLLEAILKTRLDLKKLIVASSMSIYGEGTCLCRQCGEVAPPERTAGQLSGKDWELHCPYCSCEVMPLPTNERKPLHCASVYAISKKNQEEMVLLFGKTYGVPTVALRYFNIYGTRQSLSNPYTGVAAIFASRLMNGNAPVIFEDGQQLRDFVSVHDVVQANLLALRSSEADGMALNVASGDPVSVMDVATEIATHLGVEVSFTPTEKYRVGDVRHCFADIGKISNVLGYKPRTTFRDGMAQLVEWLKSQQAEDRTQEAFEQLAAYKLVA
jgi:dTDP-L-rhamnose 4-epimerase